MTFRKLALWGAAAAGLATLAGCKEEAPDATLIGRAVVFDGDTLQIDAHRIRLNGADAPERDQICRDETGAEWACGAVATARLEELIGASEVSCAPRERDRYDRIVADCSANGLDLGGRLVAEGLAWAYRRYSTAHAAAEDYARAKGFGVWNGEAQVAWDYRADQREMAEAAATAGLDAAAGFAPASGFIPASACADEHASAICGAGSATGPR